MENKHLGSSFNEYMAEQHEEMAKQLEAAIEVIRFYGAESNWDVKTFKNNALISKLPGKAREEAGTKARAFLEKLEKV